MEKVHCYVCEEFHAVEEDLDAEPGEGGLFQIPEVPFEHTVSGPGGCPVCGGLTHWKGRGHPQRLSGFCQDCGIPIVATDYPVYDDSYNQPWQEKGRIDLEHDLERKGVEGCWFDYLVDVEEIVN